MVIRLLERVAEASLHTLLLGRQGFWVKGQSHLQQMAEKLVEVNLSPRFVAHLLAASPAVAFVVHL